MKRVVIAVDGPSGAGKGTVARAVARALGYRHVDTGAMYRAVAWAVVRRAGGPGEAAKVASESTIDIADGRTSIDGQDVTSAIRTPEIDRASAAVARDPDVRAALVARQRALGAQGGVVMEGRDIGTVVFPHAEVKVYLDASPEERARRRAADPAHSSGKGGDVAHVAEDLAARDKSDSTRSVAPLTRAADAAYIDTTGMPIEDVVARVLAVVASRVGTRDQGPGPRA
ncbi:MAG: (d)CMP kinase [Vicinamibacterales bacterium]